MLRVTSALLYSGVCLGHEGDNVTEVHLSKQKLLKRQERERKKRKKNEEERKDLLWETDILDFLIQTV